MNCIELGQNHTYPNYWKLNETNTSVERVCKTCGFTESFSDIETYIPQIQNQEEAKKYFKLFKHINDNKIGIEQILYQFIDLYFTYLDEETIAELIQKMKKIEVSTQNAETKMYINSLSTCIQENNLDGLWNILDEIKPFNNTTSLEIDSTTKHH